MSKKKEKQLVEAAKSDPDAFGALFEEHYPKIIGYAVRRVGNVAVAQDITSEVFFKALKNVHKFEYRGVPFCAWLYKIATNEINHYFRNKKVRLVSLDVLHDEHGMEFAGDTDIAAELHDAEAMIERHESFTQIRLLIAQLPLKYQEVLALRYFEDKRVKEISEILDKKQGTVKSLLSRGIGKLSAQIRAEQEKKFETSHIQTQPIATMSVIKNEQS